MPPATTTTPLSAVKSVSHFQDFDHLDQSKANYTAWASNCEDALTLVGLWKYTQGKVPCPDATADPSQHKIWMDNDAFAKACIRTRLTSSEKEYIRECKTSQDIWSTLEKRHRKEGQVTQMSLLQEALHIQFSRTEDLNKTSATIRDLSKHIFEIGFPDVDAFTVILLLNAMSNEFIHIRDSLDTLLSCGTLKLATVISRIEQAQRRIEEENKHVLATEKALAARDTRSAGKRAMCSNCKGAHSTEKCFSKGGAMEGPPMAVL